MYVVKSTKYSYENIVYVKNRYHLRKSMNKQYGKGKWTAKNLTKAPMKEFVFVPLYETYGKDILFRVRAKHRLCAWDRWGCEEHPPYPVRCYENQKVVVYLKNDYAERRELGWLLEGENIDEVMARAKAIKGVRKIVNITHKKYKRFEITYNCWFNPLERLKRYISGQDKVDAWEQLRRENMKITLLEVKEIG